MSCYVGFRMSVHVHTRMEVERNAARPDEPREVMQDSHDRVWSVLREVFVGDDPVEVRVHGLWLRLLL